MLSTLHVSIKETYFLIMGDLSGIVARKIRILLILLCTLVLGIVFTGYSLNCSMERSQSKPTTITYPLQFYDELSFREGVREVEAYPATTSARIAGGIVPHHLYVSSIIADLFYRLSQQKPKTLVIIGPNHLEKGRSKVITGNGSWETPFGYVQADDQFIADMVKQQRAVVNNEVVLNEHAMGGLMPFMKYYLPDTKVVPLVLSAFMKQREVEAIAEYLKRETDQHTVVIASIDFSHNLVSSEAVKRDEISLAAINNRDYAKMATLTNEYVDSVPSLMAMVMVMSRKRDRQMEVIKHTNSGLLSGKVFEATTSYFEVVWMDVNSKEQK